MTRLELLKIVVGQARENGFEFRRWYTSRLGVPWTSSAAAFTTLESERRYYALLFSHEFASNFWKPGSEITFQVARQTFQRTMPDGSVRTITRKAFTRRSARKDVWRYHLREMALADEPLRYIRKYLHVEDAFEEPHPALSPQSYSGRKRATKLSGSPESKQAAKRTPRPLPTDTPAFLRRP